MTHGTPAASMVHAATQGAAVPHTDPSVPQLRGHGLDLR